MCGYERREIMNRRQLLQVAAAAPFAAPAIVGAQEKVLRITTWGGKWGEIMKGEVLPAFEKEHKCKVEVDSAFPFVPKLVYDVLHTNPNEQTALAEIGLVEPKIDPKKVPNLADVYPYAVSEKMIG